MNIGLHLINDSNKMLLRKATDANAIYYSELKEGWYTPDALRAFSIKLVLEGSIHYKISGREFDLKAGNFFLASYQPGVKANIDKAAKTLCIDINPGLFAEAYSVMAGKNNSLSEDFRPGKFEYPHFPDSIYTIRNTELGKLLHSIVTSITAGNVFPPVICHDILFELLEKIIYLENENRCALSNLSSVKTTTKKEILLRLRDGKVYIDDNFLNNPTVPEIARQSNMSEFHFFRCFKQAYGTTPYQYILSKRLSYSKGLLSKGMPVHKTAFLCGFPDSRTYTKAFTRYYSLSPSQYCKTEKELASEIHC